MATDEGQAWWSRGVIIPLAGLALGLLDFAFNNAEVLRWLWSRIVLVLTARAQFAFWHFLVFAVIVLGVLAVYMHLNSGKIEVEGVLWRWRTRLGGSGYLLEPYCPECSNDYRLVVESIPPERLNFFSAARGVLDNACRVKCEECGFKKRWRMGEEELRDRVGRVVEKERGVLGLFHAWFW